MLGGTIAFGDDSPASFAIAVVFLVGLLGVAVSTVNLIYWFLSSKLRYRCPECRAKCSRVDEALPDIYHYCAACNIEWDTGIEESTSGSVTIRLDQRHERSEDDRTESSEHF